MNFKEMTPEQLYRYRCAIDSIMERGCKVNCVNTSNKI